MGSVKPWNILKQEYDLQNDFFFQWVQIIDAIPKLWRNIIKQNKDNLDLVFLDHHLIRNSRILSLNKITSKELYSILISKINNKPSSNLYFEYLFKDNSIEWKKIYMLPHITTNNTYLRSFQYKLLNNILYLNKKLFTFKIKASPPVLSVT